MNKHTIAFEKGLICPPDNDQKNYESTLKLQNFLMSYGYMMTEEAFRNVSKADESYFVEYTAQIEKMLIEFMGSKEHKNLTKALLKFDKSVKFGWKEAFQAITGDFKSGMLGLIQAYSYKEYKEIKFGTEDDFKAIFTKICALNTLPTQMDYNKIQFVRWQFCLPIHLHHLLCL